MSNAPHAPIKTLALLAGCLLLVNASIYPTEPVQTTEWPVGEPVKVSWGEDGAYPSLSEMGPMDVSLWRDTFTHVAPLASGVDPVAKTCEVTLPAWVLQQGSTYTLRFTANKPVHVVVYSADFTLTPAPNANAKADDDANASTSADADGTSSDAVALATQSGTGTASGTAIGSGSGFRTVLTSSGSVPAWMPTLTTTNANATAVSSAGVGSSPKPLGTPPSSGGGGQAQGTQRAASGARRGAGVDVEKLKFRFVFVIWPVLMGITMAW